MGQRYLDENHLYAADLDLFGKGSLFELLCTARKPEPERTPLRPGFAPAQPPTRFSCWTSRRRPSRPQLDLREDLALLGGDVAAGVDFDHVVRWVGRSRVAARPLALPSLWCSAFSG